MENTFHSVKNKDKWKILDKGEIEKHISNGIKSLCENVEYYVRT